MADARLAPLRRVVLIYALVSFLWVLLSDKAVDALFPDHPMHLQIHTWKGWLFVLVPTGVLYVGLIRLYGRLIDSTDEQLTIARREARTSALLQALADTSPDVIFAKDHDGRYLLFNREAVRVMGVTQDEVVGRTDAELFPPQVAAQFLDNDHLAQALDRPEVFEEQVETADGRRTFQTVRGTLRLGDAERGTFGVSRDITEMVATRQRLQDGKRRYRMMFELNPMPMAVVDIQSQRFLAVNDAAMVHYGFERETFLRMTLADIQPPEHTDRMHAMWAGLSVTDRPHTVGPVVHRTCDRREIEVNLSVCDIEFDGRPARLVLVQDVTENNRLQRERDAALARLSDTLSRVTDGFMAVNPDQYLTYVNQQAAAFIAPGETPESLVGRLVWELVPGALDTRYADAFFEAMAEGRSTVVEDWFEPWQRWIECRIYPSAQGASVYLSDISERKGAEWALERSQKDLSALAARLMSQEQVTNRRIAQALHDSLGQQLSSARLYLDVIQAAHVAGTSVAPHLVSKSVELVSGAIAEVRNVLLDLRPPLLEEQGLAAALDNELRNSPAGGLGVQLALEMCPDIGSMRWPDKVEYAVFMIAREAVTNALQHAQARSVMVSLDGDAGFVCLRVEDDGVGIAASLSDGVPGHLGIVGMRERAQAVGGHLTVQARADGGTVVDLTIEGLSP